jgi:hypothetical protein
VTGGKLLGPDMTARELSPKPDLGSPEYGCGFSVDVVAGERVVRHSGGFPGISSNLDQAALPVQEAIRAMLGSRVGSARCAQLDRLILPAARGWT